MRAAEQNMGRLRQGLQYERAFLSDLQRQERQEEAAVGWHVRMRTKYDRAYRHFWEPLSEP